MITKVSDRKTRMKLCRSTEYSCSAARVSYPNLCPSPFVVLPLIEVIRWLNESVDFLYQKKFLWIKGNQSLESADLQCLRSSWQSERYHRTEVPVRPNDCF